MSYEESNELLGKVISMAEKRNEPGMSKLDMFKAVAKNFTLTALNTLDEMEELCVLAGAYPELKKRYKILYNNLYCLKRLCEGEV